PRAGGPRRGAAGASPRRADPLGDVLSGRAGAAAPPPADRAATRVRRPPAGPRPDGRVRDPDARFEPRPERVLTMRVRRVIFVTVLDALVLLALSWLLDSFELEGPGSALGAAALVGILNALVWPALARLTLPLNVLTLGLGGLILNALLVGLVINLLPGAAIGGLLDPVLITLVLAAT